MYEAGIELIDINVVGAAVYDDPNQTKYATQSKDIEPCNDLKYCELSLLLKKLLFSLSPGNVMLPHDVVTSMTREQILCLIEENSPLPPLRCVS